MTKKNALNIEQNPSLSSQNITSDGRRGLTIEYNLLNLPSEVSGTVNGTTMTANYKYLPDGTKLSPADNSGSGFAYLGSLVYRKDGSSYTFESTDFSAGRIYRDGIGYDVGYFVRDHLGSTRTIVDGSGNIVEQNDYYPFGGRLDNGLSMSAVNRYRFSGKEQQIVANVNLLDFGARFYDDEICRWTTIDPLAKKYFSMTPYNYCGNDPVNFVDPEGKEVRPLGEEELEVIRNTLPKEARQYVQLNENGNIDKELLSLYSGESNNFLGLVEMVNSSMTVVFSLSDKFEYVHPDGVVDPNPEQLTYLGADDFFKDTNVEYVSGLSTGEFGNYGKTLFPDNEGKQNSSSENIEIYIHPSLSALGKAEAFSHEGYGHSLLYLRNGFNHHGASHQPVKMVDTNSVLRNMIFTARKETINNFNK